MKWLMRWYLILDFGQQIHKLKLDIMMLLLNMKDIIMNNSTLTKLFVKFWSTYC